MVQRVARFRRNLVDILLHASADIQQQDQIEGLVAVRERDNRLRLALIGERKVIFGEILDQIVTFRHLHIHAHVGHAGFKGGCWRRTLLDVLRRVFSIDLIRILGPQRR